MSDLEVELGSVRSRKSNLLKEREELMFNHVKWTVRLEKIERHIVESLGQDSERKLRMICDRDGAVEYGGCFGS